MCPSAGGSASGEAGGNFGFFAGVGIVQKNTRIAFLAAAAALALPAATRAQTQPAPAPAPPAPTAPAAPANEAEQLRQRIGQLQQQALQDPSLKPAQDSFNLVVSAAMGRLDPAAPAKLARANSINAEAEAARTAGDNARINALAEEATALKTYFDSLRPRAMADPQVVAARQVWLGRVLDKMKQIDPNAQQYVDRLTALSQGSGSGH
jgi:type IV secretory pathway VirB10-like protein